MTRITGSGQKMTHMGGRAWKHEDCGSYVTADFECCEPPKCNCGAGSK